MEPEDMRVGAFWILQTLQERYGREAALSVLDLCSRPPRGQRAHCAAHRGRQAPRKNLSGRGAHGRPEAKVPGTE
eukprot:1566489-Pleurochrysis_carterae.AAC.1